ncbi:MAG: ABC transporter ATP-binding protein [Chlamydiae bacterium GWC2_50_10]|nr:MAG: ABC transporter ATP-binding protein [Chlamydiae bacterium GWA2_50_15]OGN53675.1 MAG: ABC transporter ATP-binding protein [Chlamydiae bacterium GWC2_50_10]OGN56061.1 MAG: ABC transporter ATP-binding protein [Chlamydiae bacterium GWF2_49_8]OGN58929.1 MAG: ABC transporter ATP-binding protein [Chlamydiae bacterium RIFCSPHIGHO2_02_FULL_49_29]OGN63233.1 MAG: ABC transporter ATP-binding protein [Chlamydiae bacterium RIFCSPHIGHO2_12_FULL_49_32]OGN71634.1 MAG: ABC transporter ATP-binding protei
MKLLLKAALHHRKHFTLLIFTFLTLFALTIASQMEMFALGILSSNGADFFALFSPKKEEVIRSHDAISLHDVKVKWHEIDTEGSGIITKEKAAAYMEKRRETNPLNWILRNTAKTFHLSDNINVLIGLLVVIAVFKAIWLFLSRFTTQLFAIRISRDLRQRYFEHIQSLPMSFYQEYNIGSLSSRVVGDAGQIASSLNSSVTNFLQTPFTIVTSLLVCFYLSWQLSLVILVGLPMIIMPIVFLAKRVKRVTRQLQLNQERFASVLIDFLAGIQTVKIFAMELFSRKKYEEQNDRMAVLESKTAKYALLTRPILHAITTLCIAGVVIFGLYTLGMPLSQLIVFSGMLHLAYEPVKKFADENANIQRGVVAAERMFEVLNIKPHIEDQDGALELSGFNDSIEFDRVWFRYQGEWILKDVSFTVRKGQTVAIVGPTGAGKSTIVQLLPRLYEVQKGEIRIDGKPLNAYTQKSLRENIAFVSQRPFLFYDTVAANISFGRHFSQEEIENSAKRAHAHEFIKELPDKYHTMLTDAGQNLSGGQQQRLAIARALLKDAPVLILDEATSALDAISENRIKSAIFDLHGEVTQILIAHRLGTIEHADKIIYLEKGEKIAEGSKKELLKHCVEFRQMWEALYRTEKSSKQESELPVTLG